MDTTSERLTIWTNYAFPDTVEERLRRALSPHALVRSASMQSSNLQTGVPDPTMSGADIVLGQPHPEQLRSSSRIRWVHLTSAGYERYDNPELRELLGQRDIRLTTSSAVYADPCAQHLLGFLFAGSRRIGDAVAEQRGERRWVAKELRRRSSVLTGQALLMFGYGAIGRRLTQLLAPLEMRLGAVRRAPSGDEPIRVLREAESADALAVADHVVCILPGGTATARYFDRARFSAMKPGARFYNIGRGTTVDQDALLEALDAGTLDSAYLDVTDPEPLPAEHPLWAHPRCIVTPHTAGGFEQEYEALADHFLTNFRRYIDREPLHDRVL